MILGCTKEACPYFERECAFLERYVNRETGEDMCPLLEESIPYVEWLREGEQKINKPKIKIEEELNKIPEICSQKPCYFDLLKDSENRDKKLLKLLAEERCVKICPKYENQDWEVK